MARFVVLLLILNSLLVSSRTDQTEDQTFSQANTTLIPEASPSSREVANSTITLPQTNSTESLRPSSNSAFELPLVSHSTNTPGRNLENGELSNQTTTNSLVSSLSYNASMTTEGTPERNETKTPTLSENSTSQSSSGTASLKDAILSLASTSSYTDDLIRPVSERLNYLSAVANNQTFSLFNEPKIRTTPVVDITTISSYLEDELSSKTKRLYERCQSSTEFTKCFGDKRNCFKSFNCTFLGVIDETPSSINVSVVTSAYDPSKDSINVTITLRRDSKDNNNVVQCGKISFKSFQVSIQPRRSNQTQPAGSCYSTSAIDKLKLRSECETALMANMTFKPEETLGIKFSISQNDTSKLVTHGVQHVSGRVSDAQDKNRQSRTRNLASAELKGNLTNNWEFSYSKCFQKDVTCFADQTNCVMEKSCGYLAILQEKFDTVELSLVTSTPTSLSQVYFQTLQLNQANASLDASNTSSSGGVKICPAAASGGFNMFPYLALPSNHKARGEAGLYLVSASLETAALCQELKSTVAEGDKPPGSSETAIREFELLKNKNSVFYRINPVKHTGNTSTAIANSNYSSSNAVGRKIPLVKINTESTSSSVKVAVAMSQVMMGLMILHLPTA